MKYNYLILLVTITIVNIKASGQTISSALPKKISAAEKFLFYLHGGVVTEKGNNGITASMPQWGPYEYVNILDSLRRRQINVISENRRHGINDSVYVDKVLKYYGLEVHRLRDWLKPFECGLNAH